jgi:two-component system, OmpR family, sensor kinase
MRLPIRTRLTLLFAGLTAVVLAAAAAALLLGFRAASAATIDEGLRSRFEALAADPARAIGSLPPSDEEFAQYLSPEGALVTTEGPTERLLPRWLTETLGAPRSFDGWIRTPEEVVPVRILAGRVTDGGIVMVGLDVEDQREAFVRLATMVAIGGPFLLLVIALLGWILAGSALRPVERLREEAAAISTIEPSRRLPLPETGDELQRLAETLNGMLDRLHEALDRERRFVDEASHELRTPLAVLQAEVELALREPRGREELEAALRSIQQEADRLGRLTQDLLVLARSDRGRLPVHREETDVGELLERVAAEFAPRAATSGVRLRVDGDGARGRIDADRIRQALENLLDNALRHSSPGVQIDLGARRDAEGLHLSVRDTGPGFPEDLLPHAFERFARDDVRSRGEGAGLGLAIVRAVAEAHGGTATAENPPSGGAAVSIHVPV